MKLSPVLFMFILSCLTGSAVAFQSQDTPDRTDFENHRSALSSNELEKITGAVLAFSKNREGTIEFLDAKLVALRLDEETFAGLLVELCGEDKEVAKSAHEKLCYLDPRLLMPIREINEKFEQAKGNPRFAEVIMEMEFGTLGDTEVPYNFSDDGNGSIASGYQMGRSNQWVSPDLKMLCELGGKQSWSRAVCTIKILEHIGTPQAIGLIARLARGNPSCPVTKLAREIGIKLKKPTR